MELQWREIVLRCLLIKNEIGMHKTSNAEVYKKQKKTKDFRESSKMDPLIRTSPISEICTISAKNFALNKCYKIE